MYTYLPPFVSLFSPNQYDTAHCLEHCLKCWNSSDNPASWNCLVKDKHMEECHSANNHNIQGWKLPQCMLRSSVPQHSCFFEATLNICQFSYKAVLKTDLILPWWEILTDPYSVGLPSVVLVPHHSLRQLCMGLWGLSDSNVFPTTCMHVPLCSYTFQFIPSDLFRGFLITKMDWSIFFSLPFSSG